MQGSERMREIQFDELSDDQLEMVAGGGQDNVMPKPDDPPRS
jgi:hypothetical protein